ncbi:type II toxin-antitoxin system HipA family toxin [Halieaceae bacterium IMCC14734]|uniref:Type II toxin-antitoxin system HipA family toxin n=1 Tax=Candidatus Litorirhabdus singularis TaxID=2518993 RepID=A0ABT3TGX6_9GAMM|nr:type II toxin-antitoxin system HipA family toxin [Candidatus Litorirhabdus singularis]MCX2981562.1 type II toxin-antitoxin system HipA family toxin [Candidatus Litorirhabdus singularis]
MTVASVSLWGSVIGAIAWDSQRQLGAFEYAADFAINGPQIAPLTMPIGAGIFEFAELERDTFKGLPGLLADALPDKFGNAVINAWLDSEGRRADSLNPVERLCYIGSRAMGALEFSPARGYRPRGSKPIQPEPLAELSGSIVNQRPQLSFQFGDEPENQGAFQEIMQVGTSAGGARAKAIVAWNRQTNEVRSGQLPAPEGFGYWILKFDGVSANPDQEEPQLRGHGLIEYAYHLMALAAGIEMQECGLLTDGSRQHFATRRFDRDELGNKIHMLTLCGIAHFDFNRAGAYSYEQALAVIQRLGCGRQALEQQFKRMVFNVLARNQADHTKNIAFLMDKSGDWRLAPAYDMNFAYNPRVDYDHRHQMSINGKRDGLSVEDLLSVGRFCGIKRNQGRALISEVQAGIDLWRDVARQAGVADKPARDIGRQMRRL